MKNALSLTGILKWIVKHYKTIAIATGTLIAVFGFVGVERQRIVSGTAIPDGVAYINPERSAKVRLASDISGFRCRIVLRDGFEEMQITQYRFDPTNRSFMFEYPKSSFTFPKSMSELQFWNSDNGKRIEIAVLQKDQTSPKLRLLAVSPAVKRGGSGVAAVAVEDASPVKVFFIDNQDGRIEALQYRRRDVYAAFIGCRVNNREYSVKAVAVDLAGNESELRLPVRTQNVAYKTGTVWLTRKVEEQRSEWISEKMKMEDTIRKNIFRKMFIDQFRYLLRNTVNPAISRLDETIDEMKYIPIVENTSLKREEFSKGFAIKAFKPLAKFRKTSPFGSYRKYYINGEESHDSTHYGLDMANQGRDPIHCSIKGVVIFAGKRPEIGNAALVYHGMNLYTLYCHCTELYVKQGDRIEEGKVLGITGKTGTATGDHLHFSVIVSGIYVNPEEWMDEKWIKNNILSVFVNAGKRM